MPDRVGAEQDDGAVVVLGGRSEIGLALAERLVAGRRAVLAARRSGELHAEASRLLAAGAREVILLELDADDLGSHEAFVARLVEQQSPLDLVVFAFGVLGEQSRAERDPEHAVAVVHTDYVAQVSLLTLVSQALRRQGRGRLVVFSSVAGVRVRRANYVYGSAKAGLDGFASGLTDALRGTGVRLLLVRPGFVVGRMTRGMPPAPFATTPDHVADAVVRALRRGRSEVWVPSVLRPLFFGLRMLPRSIWRRLPR